MPITCSVSTISWYMLDHKKSKRIPEKTYFCFIDYTKAFDSVEHNKLENSSRDGNTRPSYLLRNLYAGQEATFRTGNGTTDCFQIGKGVRQGGILSPCLFNLYVEFSSVQFSRSVVSNSLWPHGLQHTRPRCPSPTPGVSSNSCPLSRWCHPTISSSVVPFSFVNLSQDQSLFKWVSSSHQVARVL